PRPPRRRRAKERQRGLPPTLRIQAAEPVLHRRGDPRTRLPPWPNPTPNVRVTALPSDVPRGETAPLRGCRAAPPRVQATPHQRPKRLIRPTERSRRAGPDRPPRSVRSPVERVTAAEQLTQPGVHLSQRRFGLGFNPPLDVPPRRRGELPCTANNPTPGQPRNAARILGQALHRCLAQARLVHLLADTAHRGDTAAVADPVPK